MTHAMDAVISALAGKRFPLEDEKATQAAIEKVFAERWSKPGMYAFSREVRIAGGIIDFMVHDCGVEIKIKGQAAAIVRQLRGYAAEPSISGLVLVTAKPLALEMIAGKPVAVFDMARAWL